MSQGGVLTIDTVTIDVDTAPEPGGVCRPSRPAGRCVRLRVGDNGIGMAPEVAAHVFEPFYTTNRDGGGTRLGLTTVYGIAAQTDATIDLQSQLGAGTTFTIMVVARSLFN